MQSPVEQLKDRVLSKSGTGKQSDITCLLELARGFGCLGEIIGREFEVKDNQGRIVYTISQRPMAIKQVNTLLKEFEIILRLDNEREAAKWGTKKGQRK